MPEEQYYQDRINKAVRYIDAHLNEEISIADLAAVAHFSIFHFQRIYKALQGETPYETIKRQRLEKAVFLLKYYPELAVREVATRCGFPTIENFSRQFKARFNTSPSAFKKDKALQNSRIYQEHHLKDFYTCVESKEEIPVYLEEWQPVPIVFIRAIYGSDGTALVQHYQYLMAWAERHNILYRGPGRRFGMSIDNPDVTPAGKYRYDFALRLEKNIPLYSELVDKGEIAGGMYATAHCTGDLMAVAKTWDFLYKDWLPRSGFVPCHQPALEEFIEGPETIGWERFNLTCRIPVTQINLNKS